MSDYETVLKFPRIRDLPEEEREPFEKFLWGQARPLMWDVPIEDQDAYYPWDYANWKRLPKG